jgi:hypothetical protein
MKLPKTDAGRRTIFVPRPVMKSLVRHVEIFAGPEPEALVVVGRGGANLSRDALQGSWERARLAIGRPDLRHASHGFDVGGGNGSNYGGIDASSGSRLCARGPPVSARDQRS